RRPPERAAAADPGQLLLAADGRHRGVRRLRWLLRPRGAADDRRMGPGAARADAGDLAVGEARLRGPHGLQHDLDPALHRVALGPATADGARRSGGEPAGRVRLLAAGAITQIHNTWCEPQAHTRYPSFLGSTRARSVRRRRFGHQGAYLVQVQVAGRAA